MAVAVSSVFSVVGNLNHKAAKPSGVPLTSAIEGSINGSSSNLGKSSYRDLVKNNAIARPPSLKHFLVQKAPALSIPTEQDTIEQAAFLNSNGFVCRLNGL